MTDKIGGVSYEISATQAEAGAQRVVKAFETVRKAAEKSSDGAVKKLKTLEKQIQAMSGSASAAAKSSSDINKLVAAVSSLSGVRGPNSTSVRNIAAFLKALQNVNPPSAAKVKNIADFAAAVSGLRGPSPAAVKNIAEFLKVAQGARTFPGIKAVIQDIRNIGRVSAVAAGRVTQLQQALSSIHGLNGRITINYGGNRGGAPNGPLPNPIPRNAHRDSERLRHSLIGLRTDSLSLSAALLRTHVALQGLLAVGGLQQLIEANVVMQQTEAALLAVSGSAALTAENLGYVRQVSDNLGIAMDVAAKGYSRLLASAQGTAFTVEDTRTIFENMSTASRVLGLDTENVAGVFRALEQIISKDSLQMEELRGQLGDRLPGAFNVMSKALGVTTSELTDLMKKGQVTGEMLRYGLIKFSDEYAKRVGPGLDKALNSIQASFGRLRTAWILAANELGQAGFNDLVISVSEAIRGMLNAARNSGALLDLGDALRWVGNHLDEIAAAAVFAGTVSFVKLSGGVGLVTAAVNGLTVAVARNPIGALAGAAAALATYLAINNDLLITTGERAASVGSMAAVAWQDLTQWIDASTQSAQTLFNSLTIDTSLDRTRQNVVDLVRFVTSSFLSIPQIIGLAIMNVWGGIIDYVTLLINTLFENLKNSFKDFPSKIVRLLSGDTSVFEIQQNEASAKFKDEMAEKISQRTSAMISQVALIIAQNDAILGKQIQTIADDYARRAGIRDQLLRLDQFHAGEGPTYARTNADSLTKPDPNGGKPDSGTKGVTNYVETQRNSLQRTIDEYIDLESAAQNYYEAVRKGGKELSAAQVQELSALYTIGELLKENNKLGDKLESQTSSMNVDDANSNVRALIKLNSLTREYSDSLDALRERVLTDNTVADRRDELLTQIEVNTSKVTAANKQYAESLKRLRAEYAAEASQIQDKVEDLEFQNTSLQLEVQYGADAAGVIRELALQRRLEGIEIERANELRKLSIDLVAAEEAGLNDTAEAIRQQMKTINELYDRMAEGTSKNSQLTRQKELADEWGQIWGDAADDVGSMLKDAFISSADSGEDRFKDMANRIYSTFQNLAWEVAEMLVFQPMMQEVKGVMGLAPTGANGSVSGGFGDIAQLANLGRSSTLYDVGKWVATSQFGQTIGMSTPTIASTAATYGVNAAEAGASIAAGQLAPAGGGALSGFGQAFADGLSASPWGIIGSLGANLLFDNLNPIGGTVGGLVGSVGGGMAGSALLGPLLGMAGGPVGAILGAFIGTALGGQIGGGVPHPGASYEATIGEDGKLGRPSIKSKHMDADAVTQLGSALQQYTTNLSAILGGSKLTGNVGATIDETEGRTAFLTRGGSGTGLESLTREDGVRFYDFDPNDEASQARAITRLTLDVVNNAEDLSETTRRVVDNLIAAAKADENLKSSTVEGAIYLSRNWDEVMEQMRTGVVDLRSAVKDEAVTAIDTMITQVKTFQETVNAGFGANSAEATEAASALKDAVAIFSGLKDGAEQMSEIELRMAQLNARYDELPRLFEAVGYSAAEAAELAKEAYQRTVSSMRSEVNKSLAVGILEIADPQTAAIYAATRELDAMRKDVEAVGGDMDLFRKYEALTLMRAAESAAIEEQTKALEDSVSKFGEVARSLNQTRLDLLLDPNLSPLSPQERLAEAERQFNEVLSKAKGGDVNAMSQLSDISRTYLEVLAENYTTAEEAYRIGFEKVQDALRDTETIAERQVRIAQDQLNALNQSNGHLNAISAALGALGLSQNRQWSATGYEQNQTANKVLAYSLGYQGAFGGGGFDAWIQQQNEDTKARAREILTSFGQQHRINFASGGLASPGMAIVGESSNAAELVDFKNYARVYSNSELTEALMRGTDMTEVVSAIQEVSRMLQQLLRLEADFGEGALEKLGDLVEVGVTQVKVSKKKELQKA